MATYSREFKDKMVAKLLHPDGPSVIQLAEEIGVSISALYYWQKEYKQRALNLGTEDMDNDSIKKTRPQNWSAEAKLNAVIRTSSMTEDEIGSYCREHGIYSHNLSDWKHALLEGLKPSIKKEQRAENIKLKSELKELKSELIKKEKALAEASALLILKKKANLIWGDEKDD